MCICIPKNMYTIMKQYGEAGGFVISFSYVLLVGVGRAP